MSKQSELLTTKQLPEITGLSASYFEKGRGLGYGPRFIRVNSGGRSGKILYRRVDVENWLSDLTCEPQGGADVQ
ncbi:helix-turn-helix transcriptional regulator [Ruegeria atlantica]|uniref:helix-turn-helix transcriptional regulator n=1 Tax=Ruegeria atlantica TaxID=81569 RepID=UPI00147DDC28|nr:hypothetical protein [Ruegeria atlantica]